MSALIYYLAAGIELQCAVEVLQLSLHDDRVTHAQLLIGCKFSSAKRFAAVHLNL